MKKKLSLFIVSFLLITCLMACNSTGNQKTTEDNKIEIVTTIFPTYDWIMNILGDNPGDIEVNMLLDNGVDLHNFQPTAEDIMKISTCDLFIYVGGESDNWVQDALQEVTNKDMVVINLLDTLGSHVKEEEHVEGMEEEHEHEEEHDHEEEHEYDEHVWLSLRNAKVFVESISETIKKIDLSNEKTYTTNTTAYVDKLNQLDKQYEETISKAKYKTLLFGDRFPFRYFVDDYGLSYYAAFAGCSAETEASFETIAFLAKKVDELNLHTVMTIEGSNHRVAQTIVQSTKDKNQQILTMDSMQSTTAKDIQAGVTYLSIMEKNKEIISEALK